MPFRTKPDATGKSRQCFPTLHRVITMCKWKDTNLVELAVVYLSFLLDNVLLTVVVPIIPDYLFSHDVNSTKDEVRLRPESLSPLQRKFETLENDNGPLGTLLASKAFVQLIFTPVIGYMVGVFGCKIPLLLGSLNMLLAALLFAYGRTYLVLVLARALHGTSSAAVAVSGMCLLAETVPKELRFKIMPIAFGGIAVGVLIGYPFGGAAYQYIGKPAPFLIIALLISFSIVLQLRNFNDGALHERSSKVDLLEWVFLLKDKNTLIVSGAICICTTSMAVLEPCIPMWLLAKMNPPPTRWQLGAVFIPDSVGYFIGSHFAGLLPVVPWRTAITAMLISGLSCCAVPLANSLEQLAIPHFCLGLGVGSLDAALVPLLANLVDTRGGSYYGPVYALQQASVSLAYSLGPFLGGQAVHTVGFPWLMRFVGFLNILFCPILLELEEEKEKQVPLLKDDDSLPSYSTLENTFSENGTFCN